MAKRQPDGIDAVISEFGKPATLLREEWDEAAHPRGPDGKFGDGGGGAGGGPKIKAGADKTASSKNVAYAKSQVRQDYVDSIKKGEDAHGKVSKVRMSKSQGTLVNFTYADGQWDASHIFKTDPTWYKDEDGAINSIGKAAAVALLKDMFPDADVK